jgi:hypothetical protein
VLQKFLGCLRISLAGGGEFAKPINVSLTCNRGGPALAGSGNLLFEFYDTHGAALQRTSGRLEKRGETDMAVTVEVSKPGSVCAFVEPVLGDGSRIWIQELGVTMDRNWDGVVDLADSLSAYACLDSGDRAVIEGAIDYSIELDVAEGVSAGDTKVLSSIIADSGASYLSSLGRDGRYGGERRNMTLDYKLDCDGDWLGPGKREAGAFAQFLVMRLFRCSSPGQPQVVGREAIAVVFVPAGVGITTKRVK